MLRDYINMCACVPVCACVSCLMIPLTRCVSFLSASEADSRMESTALLLHAWTFCCHAESSQCARAGPQVLRRGEGCTLLVEPGPSS